MSYRDIPQSGMDVPPGFRGLQPSSSVSAKVGEVFLAAGYAFQKLGDLTLQLNSASETQENMKWTEAEAEQLKGSLERFAQDLENISQAVQARTTKQVKTDLKRKAVQDQQEGFGPMSLTEIKRQQVFTGPPSSRKTYGATRGRPPGPSKSYAAANTPRNMPPPSAGGMSVYSMSDSYGSEIGPPQF